MEFSTKLTIEECESINISDLIRYLRRNPSYLLDGNELVAELNKLSALSMKTDFLGLYLLRLRFTTSKCLWNSVRYWFLCPDCNRRVGKLYVPLSATTFKCRNCYQLTYRSAQLHNHRVNLLKKQFDALGKADPEALRRKYGDLRRTKRGQKLLVKVCDKEPIFGRSPYLMRRRKEEKAFEKYVMPLIEMSAKL